MPLLSKPAADALPAPAANSASPLTRSRRCSFPLSYAFNNVEMVCSMEVSLLLVLLRGQPGDHAQIFERRNVARHRMSGDDLAQQSAHDFSAACFRKRVGEPDLFGTRERANFMRHPLAQLLSQLLVIVIALF